MTQEAHPTPPPPPKPVLPSVFAESGQYRVAIYAPRGPRMYLGPRVLLWDGTTTWACETSPFDAWQFSDANDASNAAADVLATFEWNTPAARDRIVEIIDAAGVVVSKIGVRANGIGALRLV